MPSIVIQQQNVPLCTLVGGSGQSTPLYITSEWRRPLEQLAQAVNTHQDTITDLTARVKALEAKS